eukprot:3307098-Prymnesium_polylepis.1
MAKVSGTLAIKVAVVKLRLCMKRILKRCGLSWADVKPAVEAIDTVKELETAAADPETFLLQSVAKASGLVAAKLAAAKRVERFASVEQALKSQGVSWADVAHVLEALDTVQDVEAVMDDFQQLLQKMDASGGAVARKAKIIKLRPRIERVLKAQGLSWTDVISVVEGANADMLVAKELYDKLKELCSSREAKGHPASSEALLETMAKAAGGVAAIKVKIAQLSLKFKEVLKYQMLTWADVALALQVVNEESELQTVQKEVSATTDRLDVPLETRAATDKLYALLEMMAKAGGRVAIKVAVVKLRPSLEPELKRRGLSWKDVAPVLLAMEGASGLRWRCIGANRPAQGRALVNEELRDYMAMRIGLKWKEMLLGLEWEEVGTEKPTDGKELDNKELAEALRRKTAFVSDEWEQFDIKGLTTEHFIKSGDRYFRPVQQMGQGAKTMNHEELSCKKLSEALESETEFAEGRWKTFGIQSVHMHHCVRSGDKYFQPAGLIEFRDRQEDSEAFGISELSIDSFIQSGGFYFQPCDTVQKLEAAKNDPAGFLQTMFTSGLKWEKIPGRKPAAGRKLLNAKLSIALAPTGLKWEKIFHGRPAAGRELQNTQLSQALTGMLGLKWNDVSTEERINGKELMNKELAEALQGASGLKWSEAGTELPLNCTRLTNHKLSEALESKAEFTEDEWHAFGIVNRLQMNHCIKSGDKYFQPAEHKTTFAPAEWQRFGIKELRAEHFIKSGDKNLKPAGLSGLIWKDVGISMPVNGKELENKKL